VKENRFACILLFDAGVFSCSFFIRTYFCCFYRISDCVAVYDCKEKTICRMTHFIDWNDKIYSANHTVCRFDCKIAYAITVLAIYTVVQKKYTKFSAP